MDRTLPALSNGFGRLTFTVEFLNQALLPIGQLLHAFFQRLLTLIKQMNRFGRNPLKGSVAKDMSIAITVAPKLQYLMSCDSQGPWSKIGVTTKRGKADHSTRLVS